MRALFVVLAIFATSAQCASAQALSPAEQRGLTFMRAHCASCHSIGRVGPSPLAIAPPFRTLHNRYPVETLEEALGEGIVTGHPSMPEFQLDPGQINDVISYLKSLER
jgi:mono/diheme cytochrome c family protein